jgi:colicin import membrane protein
MNASTDRLEFAPPPQPGPVRAFVLAVIAHVLLMVALTWGINWNRETENVTAEAELWSSVPEQAAPKLVEATPTPPPPPPPPPRIEKKVEAPVAPPPPPPVARDPDIALEREKKKQVLARQRQEEQEKQAKLEKLEKQEKQKKLEARKKLEEQQEREEQKREELAEKKEAEERKKKEELAKAAKTQKQQREKDANDAVLRAQQLERMRGLAGATGAPTATGTAQKSAGMSDSYGGRVQARVRPHIVFTDDVSGNPAAEVEVRMAPDGTIVSRKITKSSGVKSWDEAVLRALDKAEVLPRDVDGRVPTPLTIQFKPRG